MNTLEKLWRGQFGLPLTYWGFGVLGSILVLAPVGLCSPGSTPAVLIGAAFCVYVVIVNVGIWRAANKYTGHILWAGLAKLAALLSMVAGAVLLVGMVVAPVRVPSVAVPQPQTANGTSAPAKEWWKEGSRPVN